MARTTAYSGGNKEHSFAQIPAANQKRSTFNRSSKYMTTFDSGFLIPIYCDPDILPGDTVSISTSIFSRLATPIAPLMDVLFIDFHWFFCPNRLVWDKWAYFLGEEETPGDASTPAKYSIPQISSGAGGFAELSVFDYVGLPVLVPNIEVSALPFRAMNLIWSEWYRDENLNPRPVLRRSGGVNTIPGTPTSPNIDLIADFPLFTRAKRPDYFSSALPWPQKGPAVMLPLGTSAPLLITGTPRFTITEPTGTDPIFDLTVPLSGSLDTDVPVTAHVGTNNYGALPGPQLPILKWYSPGLYADLSSASAVTINQLRQAFQIQRLLERDARGGTRLTELIRSHFGVISPDHRLMRPEYLGGGSVQVSINPVPQTSPSVAGTPQGNLAAFGTGVGSGGGFTQSFTEHGTLICFAAVRSQVSYQYGVDKMWSRKTRYDHYWPALQSLGEQTILNKEIYAQGSAADSQPFGYQERWSEYRFRQNQITGRFRSKSVASLDIWHLGQEFTSLPTLSASFIADKPPVDRVVAVPSEPEFLMDAYFMRKDTRPLPVYSVPGLTDHF